MRTTVVLLAFCFAALATLTMAEIAKAPIAEKKVAAGAPVAIAAAAAAEFAEPAKEERSARKAEAAADDDDDDDTQGRAANCMPRRASCSNGKYPDCCTKCINGRCN